jgi:hypothetical protein
MERYRITINNQLTQYIPADHAIYKGGYITLMQLIKDGVIYWNVYILSR